MSTKVKAIAIASVCGMLMLLALGGAARATDSPGPHAKTIKVISRATAINNFVDTGPPVVHVAGIPFGVRDDALDVRKTS